MRPPVIALLLAVFAAAAIACTDDAPAGGSSPDLNGGLRTIALRYDGGTLRVEVAETPSQRALGLGGRDGLDDGAGMLFDLGSTRVPTFSMRGMLFALDFIWIDEEQRVTGVTSDVEPQPGVPDSELQTYSPESPVRYVLEVSAGTAERLGIDAGDRLSFDVQAQ